MSRKLIRSFSCCILCSTAVCILLYILQQQSTIPILEREIIRHSQLVLKMPSLPAVSSTRKKINKCSDSFEDFLDIKRTVSLHETASYVELAKPLNLSRFDSACHQLLTGGRGQSRLSPDIVDCFVRKLRIHDNDQKLLQDSLHRFEEQLREAHIDMILFDRTLLSSWMYHEVGPLDIRVHFLVDERNRSHIHNLSLSSPSPITGLQFNASSYRNAHMIDIENKNYTTKLCIFYFRVKENQIELRLGNTTHLVDRDALYPLRTRPLEGRLHKTPNNLTAFLFMPKHLRDEAPPGMCKSDADEKCATHVVNCSDLKSVFPYVIRWKSSAGQFEALVEYGLVMRVFYTPLEGRKSTPAVE